MGVTHTTSRSPARLALVTNPVTAEPNPPSDVPAGLRMLRTLDRAVLEVARDVNLRPMELYALLLLDEHHEKTMTTRRLSEVLASSPSQAKQIALRLAARGYVERGGNHGSTELTPLGRVLAEQATGALRDEIAVRVARIESGAVVQASHALGSLLLD
jgi:DNA-binding MarR family transcriptional regulator